MLDTVKIVKGCFKEPNNEKVLAKIKELLGDYFILALLSSLSSVISKALSVGMVLHFLDKNPLEVVFVFVII